MQSRRHRPPRVARRPVRWSSLTEPRPGAGAAARCQAAPPSSVASLPESAIPPLCVASYGRRWKSHIARVCFRCFTCMLQVLYIDVAKVDQGVAHVVTAIHVCFKCIFQMFHLFQTYVASVLSKCCKSKSGCCLYMHVAGICFKWFLVFYTYVCKCFIWMLHIFAMIFKYFFRCFASVSNTCFKCFICLLLYIATVAFGCFKSRSGVTHGMCVGDIRGGVGDIRGGKGNIRGDMGPLLVCSLASLTC
jgi:hypothetical protein